MTHTGLEFNVRLFFWKFRFIVEKCDGVLVIENKKKKVMIDELKKKGYDPDPVKAWKIRQNRDEALVSVCGFLLDCGQNVWIGHSEHGSFHRKVKFV
jgi:hypothetical protein